MVMANCGGLGEMLCGQRLSQPVLGKVTFKSNALQYCVTP